jgi:peptidoglycan/xylan/chitin deacetylase (PgdA/CDA1 family)
LKSRILEAAMHPGLDPVFRRLRRGLGGTILTLHRFEPVESETNMLSVHALRSELEYLRKQNYALVSLASIVDGLTKQRLPPPNAVAFTVDDGYADFRDLAAPVFAAFDCPVTVFATTGPIDRTMWFWWDRIEYAFDTSRARRLEMKVGDEIVSYRWKTRAEARAAGVDFTERMKCVTAQERLDGVDRVCAALDVDTSGPRPPAYETMTWEDFRRLSSTGLVDVGPHTVTHPILSRLAADQIAWEIRESWRRLRAECPNAVPIFCYPNGTPADYTPETMSAVRRAGLTAAVTTTPGHIGRLSSDPDERYRLPRFPGPIDVAHLAQVVNGVERTKLAVMGKLSAGWSRWPVRQRTQASRRPAPAA